MRNANGTGGIVNLGKRRRRPFAVRITEGWVDGKQIYTYIGYYATKKEAQKALAEYMVNPDAAKKSSLTFAEAWEEYKKMSLRNVGKGTENSYSAAFKSLSALHDRPLKEIRTAEIQRIFDNCEKGYSGKNNMKIVCSCCFKYGMQNDVVNKNYAEFINVGKNEKKEKAVFTDDEIQKLFENDGLPYVDTVLILIFTGFRVHEFLNIKKSDVDLTNWTITGGLKTDAGKNRVIPIHPKIRKYVEARYAACPSDCGKLTPITYTAYRRHFDRALAELGIVGKTPHSTRHTAATLMGKEGVDPLAITKILGHTDYAFTVKNYTHTDVEYLADELNKI